MRGSKGIKLRSSGEQFSLEDIAAMMVKEARRAEAKRGPHVAAHHSFGVLMEEVDELWDEVKRDDIPRARFEAIQAGAMTMRFIRESAAWRWPKPRRIVRVRIKRRKVL